MRRARVALLVLSMLVGCLVLTGCQEKTPNIQPCVSPVPEQKNGCSNVPETIPPPTQTQPDIPSPPPPELEEPQGLNEPKEVDGLTSANVRLFFVDDENVRQWYPAYRLFDLDQIEQYHEFVRRENGLRIVFTTEVTVHTFKFLRIMWNDNYFDEDAEVGKKRYIIEEVLYSLEELIPEIPFVVTGTSLGCIYADNGFSFVDDTGQVRYYWFFEFNCDDSGGFVLGEF
jgi:hypothetical protein